MRACRKPVLSFAIVTSLSASPIWSSVIRLCLMLVIRLMMVPLSLAICVCQVSSMLMWAPRYRTEVSGGWSVSGALVSGHAIKYTPEDTATTPAY